MAVLVATTDTLKACIVFPYLSIPSLPPPLPPSNSPHRHIPPLHPPIPAPRPTKPPSPRSHLPHHRRRGLKAQRRLLDQRLQLRRLLCGRGHAPRGHADVVMRGAAPPALSGQDACMACGGVWPLARLWPARRRSSGASRSCHRASRAARVACTAECWQLPAGP